MNEYCKQNRVQNRKFCEALQVFDGYFFILYWKWIVKSFIISIIFFRRVSRFCDLRREKFPGVDKKQ
jgi:hypothetical protein